MFFMMGHFYAMYNYVALGLAVLLGILIALDAFLLFRTSGIRGKREVGDILSNGDENESILTIENLYSNTINAVIYEEIPHQLSLRELKFKTKINGNSKKSITYILSPKDRGVYDFGDIVVITSTSLNLLNRRYSLPASKKVSVYPSYIYLDNYSFKNFKYYTKHTGNKKIRKIGQSSEFEHIKNYVKGDDIRHINWKSSAKHGGLMVNQYMDERAQQVYSVIDTGRSMQMPFDGLSLLDYAINSSLAVSHTITRNHDRAGVMYFNKKVESILPASKAVGQLPKILRTLFNLKTTYAESNFEKLYATIKFKISSRSLLMVYTNFEDMNSVQRQLPYLKGIAKNNVLILLMFRNTEVEELLKKKNSNRHSDYKKAVAEKQVYQKKLMTKLLNRHGIHTVLTDPKSLTIDSIDKYLEIKSRGLL